MLMGRKIGCGNKTFPYISHTIFLGLTVDSILSWRNYTDLLINKLSTACYVLQSVKKYISHSTLIMTYLSLLHPIMTYGIISWGHSSYFQDTKESN